MIGNDISKINLQSSIQKVQTNLQNKDEFAQIYDDLISKNEEIKKISQKFESDLKEQDRMFKLFDLSLIYNQLMFGNIDDKRRNELFKKSLKIYSDLAKL